MYVPGQRRSWTESSRWNVGRKRLLGTEEEPKKVAIHRRDSEPNRRINRGTNRKKCIGGRRKKGSQDGEVGNGENWTASGGGGTGRSLAVG